MNKEAMKETNEFFLKVLFPIALILGAIVGISYLIVFISGWFILLMLLLLWIMIYLFNRVIQNLK